ncbi:hypothetical protein SOV92_14405 [Pectobacterium brasiliense]|uniref:Uncharacterized protein n=1 Tax=Pectobacterium brasiliense TaxID=180957 RepID=A0AAW9HD60_9GAMM|nr:hypothetical protein [Pectobacterium brasiliense]MBN3344694.1 hypothetical protein [Pectobacterium brasiliense]MDY4379008.1 hypothetical protein [Pectobacterium brasiliense]
MSISTIALIGASAALSAVLFKDKDSRVKDAIDFAKSSPEDFQSSAHYTIIRNDINAYITGIKEHEFHHVLLDIMAWGNKPIGYFGRLQGRLEINVTGQLNIKEMTWFQSFISEFLSKTGSISNFVLTLCFVGLALFAIEYGAAKETWLQAFSLVFSALAGFMLYNWFNIIAVIWKQHANKKDLKEYVSLLQNYAEEKQKEAASTIPEAAAPKANTL